MYCTQSYVLDIIISPFVTCVLRVGSRGSERLRILYKITQLINNGTKILTDELYHTGLSLLRMRAELLQSWPSLCDPMDCSAQAPLSMGFSRQETELPCPSPGDLPNPGTEPRSSALQADSLLWSHPGSLLLWRKSLKELASWLAGMARSMKLRCERIF